MIRFWYLLVGFSFGILLGRMSAQQRSSEGKYETSDRSAGQPTGSSAERPPSADDLTLIEGIGPTYAAALRAVGITRFSHLAAADADNLVIKMSAVRITAERIRRERWIEQAQARTQSAM